MRYGELIEITDTAIHVKCLNIAKNPESQHKICNKCWWHTHPGRAKGKMLHCKMY